MALPKLIQIGYNRYKVRLKEGLADEEDKYLFGKCNPKKSKISINPDQSADSMADTVLHEVLHGCWDQTSLASMPSTDGEVEELVVSSLSPALLDTLRRNPELVGYLMEVGDE